MQYSVELSAVFTCAQQSLPSGQQLLIVQKRAWVCLHHALHASHAWQVSTVLDTVYISRLWLPVQRLALLANPTPGGHLIYLVRLQAAVMPSPMHRGGANLFLGSTEILQEVLLPRLTAADLLRLSLSCKAMHSWILSTPPGLWQVSSKQS